MKKIPLSGHGVAPVFLLCALSFLSCTGREKAVHRYNGPDAETVTIGAVYPASTWDNEHYLRDALDLAVRNINEAGGVLGKPLNLVIRDDRGDSHVAQEVAETFSDSGITAVVGHWGSDVCYYVEDIYEERQIVMITPSATSLSLFEHDYQYIYRTITNNRLYAEAMADHMVTNGISRPVIFYTEDTYGTDLAQAVEQELAERSIPVVDRVTSITVANMAELLRRWRAFGWDSLVLASSILYVAEPMRIIREAGVTAPFFSETFNHTGFSDLISDLENTYGIVYGREDMDAAFLADFIATYGRIPDTYEVAGYEALRLLANAMNASDSVTSAAIVRYLRNLQDYPSVMGPISYNPVTHEFDGLRMRIKPYSEYRIR